MILSMPRSGSSWIVKLVGQADNALYLREPFTCWYHDAGHTNTMFEVHSDAQAPEPYRRAAQYAFEGYPAFRQQIAQFPEQWTPFGVANKQVVIKEVNPLALGWYLQHGPVALIFLIRHPVATTKSFLRLGWWSGDQPEDWAEFGRRILEQWTPTYEQMQYHASSLLVRYEDVSRPWRRRNACTSSAISK